MSLPASWCVVVVAIALASALRIREWKNIIDEPAAIGWMMKFDGLFVLECRQADH